MKPQRTKGKTPPRKMPRQSTIRKTEPVEVCARIRNLTKPIKGSCIEVIDEKALRLTGPAPDYRVTKCKFYEVFSDGVTQKILYDRVVSPMVDDAILGKNGLLFTYGVTSSGKTYTMTGTGQEPGFLPRTLDAIFNSIEGLQANKYVFFPDGMNGFTVQSEVDAMQLRQENDLIPTLANRTMSKTNKAVQYDLEHTKSLCARKDHRYSVFLSYTEVYNNQVYDLLAEPQLDAFNRAKPPQPHRLREDRRKNVFVYGATQVEVRDTDEAFDVLRQGQERKTIANTQLNAESSRSHCILNIRLVQVPLDPMGEDLLQETSLIRTSQLSLVDLAGSERMSRTGVTGGGRLLEAGNINGSLMTLRRCLEQLRSNQKNPMTAEMVSYRNSKLTHLFKSYFEGRGRVKMVVCINPNMEEYDENVHVMQFAETASQVEVVTSDDYQQDQETLKRKLADIKATKEQRRKEQLHKETERRRVALAIRMGSQESVYNRLYNNKGGRQPAGVPRTPSGSQAVPRTPSGANRTKRGISSSSESDSLSHNLVSEEDDGSFSYEYIDFGEVEPLPDFKIIEPSDSTTIVGVVEALQKRIDAYKRTRSSADQLRALFRKHVVASSTNDNDTKSELHVLKRKLSAKSKDVEKHEQKIRKLESKNQVLTRTTQVFEKDKQTLQDQLNDAENQYKNSQKEVRKLDRQMKGVVANTRAEVERECEFSVRNAQNEMQEKMWVKEERLRQLKTVLTEPNMRQSKSTTALQQQSTPTAKPRTQPQQHYITKRSGRKPTAHAARNAAALASTRDSRATRLANPRRSRSVENILAPTSSVTSSTTSSLKKEVKFPSNPDVSINTPSSVAKNVAKINKATAAEQIPLTSKHRRSNSNWLAHRPETTVSTDTIFQPCIRPDRVVNVPTPKDVARSSNYLLTHQMEASDGGVTTQLVKGEVYQTRTGGQQVQFTDIETLANKRPEADTKAAARKRKSPDKEQGDWTDVETRCGFGISNTPVVVKGAKRGKK